MYGLILVKLSLLLFLLLFSGFFSGSEAALFSLGRIERYRIREGGGSLTARWIRYLIEDPRKLLITILIGNELVNICAAVLTASLTHDLIQMGWMTGLSERVILKALVSAVIFTPFLLVVGEITPKTLAVWNAGLVARGVAIPLRVFYQVAAPLRWILKGLADGVVRIFAGEPPRSETPITEEEFRILVDLSREGGLLRESESEIIHNIFDFGETRVAEVMTPRTDVFCIQMDRTLDDIIRAIGQRHLSRIPVYKQDKDDVVGILYSKDLLRLRREPNSRESFDLKSILRKPYFVPQTKRANDLFREFRFSRIHMAIVVDEYGGMAGLVTMEDLLESLFGESQGEYDPEVSPIQSVEDGTVIVPARMPIEEFNRRFGANLPEEEYDTMGGLVFDLFGRLPEPGLKVSYMRYTFTVEKTRGPRILELRVQWQTDDSGSSDGQGSAHAEQAGDDKEDG